MSRLDTTSLFTRVIHAGRGPDPSTGAILPPICQSTTFVLESLGADRGYRYSRSSNPTVEVLERSLAALEGGERGLCFSSGMSALGTLALATLGAGDRVVATDVVYGGSFRLLRQVLAPLGVESEFVDTADLPALERALARRTALVLLESPANPTLKLTDLAAAAALAHRGGARVAVDNTFLTPCLQRPFELGADLVVHSTTKYIDGHNATIGGAVILKDLDLAERLFWTRQALGTIQGPFEAWLTLQGLKTLALRMERQSSSALQVARRLATHPRLARVTHPWLDSHPQHDLARRQQGAGGGIVAFEVKDGAAAAARFLESLELISLAENLGSAESLITHPASMTHASVPPATRLALGIGDGLVRLSVGLEDPGDLIDDLERALAA